MKKLEIFKNENKLFEVIRGTKVLGYSNIYDKNGIQFVNDLEIERQEKRRLLLENMQMRQIIKELQPKANYTDIILQSKYTVAITVIAKEYGISGQVMNDLLHELGVQYKVGSQWLLYAKYQNCGYTHSKTIFIQHKRTGLLEFKMVTEWTQKGRLFLYDLLKNNGLLPMIERKV